jgi:hypothetical protein
MDFMVEMLAEERHGFYVEFELRPEEDREASIAQGMPVFKDVEYAVITMPGGGLVVDKVISDELLREWKHGNGNRKPPSPFAHNAYEEWKDGREISVNGSDLKNWPGVTPAQLKMCLAAVIRTVEDLADANADTLRKLGMGSQALKEKATAYLAAAGVNKNSEAVSALKIELAALRKTIEDRDQQIQGLLSEGDGDAAPKRRGRPPKDQSQELGAG